MEKAAPSPGRRRLRTVFVRTLLVLTLLPQLGMLWVLHRPSPTSLPAGLVALVIEGGMDMTTAELERATIDSRGVLRLQGLRLRYPEERGLDGLRRGIGGLVQADLDVTLAPAWRDWLLLRPSSPALRAQGRVTAEHPARAQALLDRLDLRLEADRGAVAVARAGAFHLRAEARGERGETEGEGDLNEQSRALEPFIAALAELRNFEGGAELVANADRLRLEASGRMREGASLRNLQVGGWEFAAGAGGFSLRAETTANGGVARLNARDLRLGTARLATASVAIDDGVFRLVADGLGFAGISGGGGLVEGRLLGRGASDDWRLDARLAGELGASRLAGNLSLSDKSLRVSGLNVAAPARDLVRLPGLGEFLRGAGVDFAGRVELADAQVLVAHGRPVGASGWFAATQAGWGDIRPSSIRPERPSSALSGRWSVDVGNGTFLLDDLDLAGLRGSIGGGLRKGEPYEVRLRSTEGNPVHPGCLNSLLGEWWVDLWKLFDLSTTGTAPHAEVVVLGKWGEASAERVAVSAALENFGFMGARFASTRVRVDATRSETQVRIDELAGLLEGKPAGTARGLVRWDWNNPAWGGRPEILAEGDLEPACALRLHDSGLAQRLRGWTFGLPWTKVRITPGKPTEVELLTGEASRLAGIAIGPMRLRLSQPPEPEAPMDLKLEAAFAGGRLELDLNGNLSDRNQVRRLALVDVGWADLQKALPELSGRRTAGPAADPATLSAEFQGQVDLGRIDQAEGRGNFLLKDPRLKTIHLLGGVSQALGSLGIDFSTYPLTEASGAFTLRAGRAELAPLSLRGDDAVMELQGGVNLGDGRLDLKGEFRLRKSPWGILGYINPNRLIARVLKISIRGTLQAPEARVDARPF